MTDDEPKRGRGRPKVYGKRQNFAFRITDETKQRLVDSAARNGRSLSEEIEFCINHSLNWQATKQDIEEIKRRTQVWADTFHASRIRAAGLQILREIEGKPTRAIVDLETLLAEADGIARGFRSGWVDPNAPPKFSELRTMTKEEDASALAKINELLDAAASDSPATQHPPRHRKSEPGKVKP